MGKHTWQILLSLSDAALPQGQIPLALLFPSLGVEMGYFLVIGAIAARIMLGRRTKLPAPHWMPFLPPFAIGTVAMSRGVRLIAAS